MVIDTKNRSCLFLEALRGTCFQAFALQLNEQAYLLSLNQEVDERSVPLRGSGWLKGGN
jgi:hypothetical protein